jgi:hypothetical protein
METARVALGVEGVRFRYYSCPRCGHDHVFVEILALPGETPHDLRSRQEVLARAAQEVRALDTTIIVVAPCPDRN